MGQLRSVAPALVLVIALGLAAAPAAATIRSSGAASTALADAWAAFSPQVRSLATTDEPGAWHGPTGPLAALAAQRDELTGSEGLRADALLARPTDTTPVAAPTVRYDTTPATVDTASFRIHHVTTGPHAATAAFARTVAGVMEATRTRQVDELGWLPPAPDGNRGGDARTDVYLAAVASQGFLGYAATDPGQSCRNAACGGFHGYLVLDSAFAGWRAPEEILRVVAAHELNHLLQFHYSVLADSWWMEATAEWMATHTEPSLDYSSSRLRQWGSLPHVPLTDSDAATGGASKSYGSYIWNAWLARRHGAVVVRRGWETAGRTGARSVAAIDEALATAGSGFAAEFRDFTASTAEWGFADVTRAATLTDAEQVTLDHTAFTLYDVPGRGQTSVTVTGAPDAAASAGLVVRRPGGVVATQTQTLVRGEATLSADTRGAERVTVLVANTDARDRVALDITLDVAERERLPAVSGAGTVPRFDGGGEQDPVGQAIATSRSVFADGAADRVVLATADRFPDALAGAALAGARGPILFTRGLGALDGRTKAEIARVTGGHGEVLVLGGAAAVSEEAAVQARTAGGDVACAAPLPASCRFAGSGREHTAALVADVVLAEQPGRRVLIARSDDFADAVTGGAYAAASGTPVLLTPSSTASPHAVGFIRRAGIHEVVVLGGTGAVSDEVMSALPAAVRTRVAGADRSATAAEIAVRLWGVSGNGPVLLVNVRNPSGWQTALSAAVVSAVFDAPQLGVENPPLGLPAATVTALQSRTGQLVKVFGGVSLVSDVQLTAALAATR